MGATVPGTVRIIRLMRLVKLYKAENTWNMCPQMEPLKSNGFSGFIIIFCGDILFFWIAQCLDNLGLGCVICHRLEWNLNHRGYGSFGGPSDIWFWCCVGGHDVTRLIGWQWRNGKRRKPGGMILVAVRLGHFWAARDSISPWFVMISGFFSCFLRMLAMSNDVDVFSIKEAAPAGVEAWWDHPGLSFEPLPHVATCCH